MSKPVKIFFFIVSGFIGLLIFVAVAMLLFVDSNTYKTRLEATVSDALGIEVKINGRLGFSFFPGFLVTLDDIHIGRQGEDIISAKSATIGIKLLSLLNKKVLVDRITLQGASITIERDSAGRFNFEQPEMAGGTLPTLNLTDISVSGGTLFYANKQSGEEFKAGDCNLAVQRLQLPVDDGSDFLKNLSLTAELACGEMQTKDFAMSNVKLSVNGRGGVFDLNPVEMRLFDGNGSGNIRADFTNSVPLYHVRYSLSQFHLKKFFKTLPSDETVEGTMDFSANLSVQGKTATTMRENITGEISLRGDNLTINGCDLDRDFSRFESSQNFNLVDMGAFFFAGPIGLVVTKGYNFASIFQGSGGRSEIEALVSDWTVERGVALARDVAMATPEHRIALQGALDLVNEQFNDVTVALVDEVGCATVRQKIRGPFQSPLVEKPSILKSLTGPVRSLLKAGMALFPGDQCEVFYAGSVAPPE